VVALHSDVNNLILAMHGEQPLAQINPEVPIRRAV
jgi:hypothetical protein